MNFHIGQLVAWRHELEDHRKLVENHGRGPFPLEGIREERSELLLLVRTESGRVELPAAKLISLR